MRAAAAKLGTEIYIGGQLIAYDASTSWNPPDRTWNQGFFSATDNAADFFIIHSYYTTYNENSSADVILATAQTETNSSNSRLNPGVINAIILNALALSNWGLKSSYRKNSKFHGLSRKLLQDII
jgi:hypothetical protein